MDAADLKRRMQLVGAIKAQDAVDALAAHMALPIGARIEAGIALSEAVRRAGPPSLEDDEVAVMTRVAAHLRRLRPRTHDG
jgi:hypothetical protein